MDQALTARIVDTAELLRRIRADHPWQHTYLQHLAALSFTVGGRAYDDARLRSMMDRIRNSFGVFSSFRSSAFLLAVQLLTGAEDPDRALGRLIAIEPMLRDEGIRSYSFAPLLASVLVRTGTRADLPLLLGRTKLCYEELHRAHPFLTGADDYPLAAMIAVSEGNPALLMANVESIYSLLHLQGYSRGNGLQMLSLTLSLGESTPAEKVARVLSLDERLRAGGIRLWAQYYGALGLLALLPDPKGTLADEALEVVADLRTRKYYRSLEKGMLLLFATLLLSEQAVHGEGSTVAGVPLEVLIAAQTAAMVAASIAATSAASSAAT
jgi:hypothetical protein